MEIDLYWFEQNDIAGSVDRFWGRFAPLYQGVQGYKGVILNVGWTVGYIMEWSGDPRQRITLPRGAGEQPWVAETSPLPGTTAQRMAEWKRRFASPTMVQRHGYGPWTYGDLKQLASLLREGAKRRGIEQFRVGSLVYAWDNAYGEEAPWAKCHPEAFTRWKVGKGGAFDLGRFFDPGATLHADATKLGGLPNGIAEGMKVHRAFAAQWGSLSRAVGLDALMLRDSFGFPVPYERGGPEGPVMPSPEAIARETDNVSALVRETKMDNPKALLMMYSNGASAVADWRSNGLDLERIAKEGYLDIFVDQTWAGAWNEVGVRHDLFWNTPTLGWTYQLAYMLLHGAVLANTRVRHYPLVETFDAWESWDVLHTVPERLRWGIWAYSHAAVKTPHGIVMPQGSYISWANQGKRLLSQADVQFLRSNINAAVRDAAQTREVFGPTLVYSRSAMQWQTDHAKPDADIKEWIDEQAGSVLKWPVPLLSATQLEWLPHIHTDLPILQTPSHLPPNQLDMVLRLIYSGRPVAVFGSFAGGIDPKLLQLAGEPVFTATEPRATIHEAKAGDIRNLDVQHVPSAFPVLERFDSIGSGAVSRPHRDATTVIYSTSGSPNLLLTYHDGAHLALWDPPEFFGGCCKPLRKIWGGSAVPYVLTAAVLTSLLADSDALRANTIDLEQTGTICAWATADGKIHLLSGNLEEGLREDADRSRHIALKLPAAWQQLHWASTWKNDSFYEKKNKVLNIHLAPDASVLLEGTPR